MEDIESYFIGFAIIGGIYWLYTRFVKATDKYVLEDIEIRSSILKKVSTVIAKHKTQLGFQRLKSVHTDAYGKEIAKNWYEKEIPYFIEEHIYPLMNEKELGLAMIYEEELALKVDYAAKKTKIKNRGYDEKMNGFEFEIFCMKKLEAEGWKVSKTKSGADQGIDLIIEKNKRKIGVQCKKYSKPIGNKAVQEVKAGIDFYGLHEGIVLANNSYTKSAIALANSTQIKLLHYLETEKI